MKRRIGIYSGSFDPIHQGHISFALEAMRTCHLDEVVFLPEPKPRNKPTVTYLAHRITLIEQTLAGQANLSIIRPAQTRFSVRETLPELQSLFEGDSLALLIGSDVVRTFPHKWKDLNILLKNVSLVIGMRNDDTTEEITAIVRDLEKQHDITIRYDLVKTDHHNVSSSRIRHNAQHNLYT